MNKPLEILYEEHATIVEAVEMTGKAREMIGQSGEAYEQAVRKLISFFRAYADRYHHFKEEQVLFPEMVKKSELLADGIIREMNENHEAFREQLATAVRRLDEKRYAEAQDVLESYTQALLDHIAVENEELFPMAETMFDETELENIRFRFDDCDRELGEDSKRELAGFIHSTSRAGLMGD